MVTGVVLLDALGFGIVLPVAAFIVRRYDAGALAVSTMTVIYAAAQFLSAPVLGSLSDHYGRRPIILLSVLGSAVGYYLFGVAGSLGVLFFSRLIDGITGGSMSAAYAYIADITPPEERAKNYSWLGAAFGIGLVAGPAIGGLLSRVTLTAPAFGAATFSLFSAVAAYFVLPESLSLTDRHSSNMRWASINPFAAMTEMLGRPAVRVLLVTFAAFNLVFNGRNSILPVLLIDKFEAGPMVIAWLFIASGLSLGIVQLVLMPQLVKRFDDKALAIASMMIQGAGTAFMILVPSLWMFYPVTLVSVAAAGVAWPTLAAIGSNSVRSHEQGRLSGVSASLVSLTNVVGPLGAGVAYDALGRAVPFWISAALLLLAGLFFMRMRIPPVTTLESQPDVEIGA